MAEEMIKIFESKVLKTIGLRNKIKVETSRKNQVTISISRKIGRDLIDGFKITKFDKDTNEHRVIKRVEGLYCGSSPYSRKLDWYLGESYSDWQGFLEKSCVGYDLLNKDGKWVTRLASALKKYYDIKLSNEQKEHVGNLIANYGEKSESLVVTADITDDLNWNSGDYGDRGSCFWSDYITSRWAMDDDPRFYALRLYECGQGVGRAWLCVEEDNLLLFNSYHPEHGITLFGEVLANILEDKDLVSEKIDVINLNGGFYINGGSGLSLTHGKSISKQNLNLDTNLYRCSRCGVKERKPNMVYIAGKPYCNSCKNDLFPECCDCKEPILHDAVRLKSGNRMCRSCRSKYTPCSGCRQLTLHEEITTIGKNNYCEKCKPIKD